MFSYLDDLSNASVRQQRSLLVILGLIIIASGLGLRAPWQIDEVRYTGIAMEMIQSGNWLIPHRASELYAEKPPIYFWLLASSLKLISLPKIGFLVPSLLAGLLSLMLFHDMTNRLYGRKAAWYGSLLLLCTYQFFKQTQSAQIDAVLFFWVMLATYGLVRHLLLGGNWYWCYTAFVALGLGIITKGVGFLPLLLFIPFALGRRLGFDGLTPLRLRDPHWLACLLALLCGIGVWLGPVFYMALSNPSADLDQYLQTILFKQTAQRYANSWKHIQPWWFFLVKVIPVLWLPSIIFIPYFAKHWQQLIREKNGPILLFLSWTVLVILFFSLSAGKRDVYMFPALIGWVLCCTPLMPALLNEKWFQRTAFILTSCFTVLLAIAGILVFFDVGKAAKWINDPHQATLIFLLSAGWFLFCLLWAKPANGARAFFTGFVGFAIVYGFMYLPLAAEERTNTKLQQAIYNSVNPGSTLVLAKFDERLWLGNRIPIVHFGFYREEEESEILAAQWIHSHPEAVALLPLEYKSKSDYRCFQLDGNDPEVSYLKRHWVLATSDAVSDDCLATKVENADKVYQFNWDSRWIAN